MPSRETKQGPGTPANPWLLAWFRRFRGNIRVAFPKGWRRVLNRRDLALEEGVPIGAGEYHFVQGEELRPL